ncbi:MAG: ABC transporter ATP-binding protein [Paraglaciecola sp.]|uniref:ABC transporter ATP-binding protein n=1 Tax=Paraglaciecola sp. TaxID=1920173 RepID=UPI00329828B8
MINRPQKNTAIQHLIPVACTWALAAILEAACYVLLALGIIHQHSPFNLIVISIVTILLTLFASRSGFWAGAKLANTLYISIGETMKHAKISWFTATNKALLKETVSRSIPGFMSIPAHQFQIFIHAPLIPLCITLGMGYIMGTNLMFVLASLLFLSFVIQSFAQRTLAHADANRNDIELSVNQATNELIEHVELLRTASGSQNSTNRLEKNWFTQENSLSKTNTSASIATLLSAVARFLPVAGIAQYLALSNIDSTAILLAVLLLSIQATAPLEALAAAAISINDQLAAVKRYQQTNNAPSLNQPTTAQIMTPANHTIGLNNVSISSSVQNISALITKGERVLISGPSGSGKTSLLNLLMRFDDPEQGQITLGNAPLTSISHDQLSTFFAYVTQDPLIFTGTIASNIRIGNPDADDVAIDKVARQVLLGEVIDRSELGINQEVGLQGAGLSGGERQRLALARALIKNAPILVLDEATSALDDETEKQVAKAFFEQNCTLVLTSHRNQEVWQPTNVINLLPEYTIECSAAPHP